MSRSRRLVHAAVGGVVALSCAVPTAPAQAAPEADAPVGTVRLVTEKRVTVDYPWAGASGFQYRPGTTSVTTVDYPGAVPPAHAGPDDLATGTDVVNTRDGRTVTQRHRSTGVTATVTIPTGQAFRAAVGWSVLTMDGTGALHVLRTVEGTVTVDTPVTGFPAGAPWSPVWQLNKPSTWTLTLTTASGTVVRTLTGTSTGAAVRPAWDGTGDPAPEPGPAPSPGGSPPTPATARARTSCSPAR
jgi:hypothetical protein